MLAYVIWPANGVKFVKKLLDFLFEIINHLCWTEISEFVNMAFR